MKIMFICTGNTCRSAMAEAYAKKIIQDQHLNIEVYSAGTNTYAGEHASYNSIAAMKDYDVNLSLHTSTSIYDSNIENMDLILCATHKHKLSIINNYPNLLEKTYTIKEFANSCQTTEDTDISDPWGYDINIYRLCAAEICLCVDKIIQKITINTKG